MPKVVFNRGRNAHERESIKEITERVKADLRMRCGDYVRPADVAAYLGIHYTTAYRILRSYNDRRLPPLRHACGTKKFHTIDVARRLAELEVL
ncbi:MAG: helix-turn-helix domain-containing protein [Christensenellales bacterium]